MQLFLESRPSNLAGYLESYTSSTHRMDHYAALDLCWIDYCFVGDGSGEDVGYVVFRGSMGMWFVGIA